MDEEGHEPEPPSAGQVLSDSYVHRHSPSPTKVLNTMF